MVEQAYLALTFSNEKEEVWLGVNFNDIIIWFTKFRCDSLNYLLNDIKLIFEDRILNKSIYEDLTHNLIFETWR